MCLASGENEMDTMTWIAEKLTLISPIPEQIVENRV
jgi:hypothetical protein